MILLKLYKSLSKGGLIFLKMITMVLVFKTNISYTRQARLVASRLNANEKIERWNFDLDDNDKIIRIETKFALSKEVIEMMHEQDLYCEELS